MGGPWEKAAVGSGEEGSSGAPPAFLRDPEPRAGWEGETGGRSSGALQAQPPGSLGARAVLGQGFQGGTLQADSCP